MTTVRLYRDFTSQAELDREYDAGAAVPDSAAAVDRWQAASAAVAAPGAELGVAYGPTLAEHVDVYRPPPASSAAARPPPPDGWPVHLFVHGGYWRRFRARDFAFLGPPMAAAGCVAVVVNYELCPRVTLDEVARQVRAAVAWAFRHARDLGGDPARLSISGHSAGGHLAAMALATDWEGDYGLPADLIKGALPVSGLFDLAPFPYTYLQPALQLTWDQVRRNSPVLLPPPRAACPVAVAVGGGETAEFRRQSKAYAQHLANADLPARYLELEGRHHFDVLDALVEPGHALHAAWRATVGLPADDGPVAPAGS